MDIQRVILIAGAVCAIASAGWAAEGTPLQSGIAEYRLDNYEEAQVRFAEAAKLKEDGLVSYYQGLVQKRMGDNRKAVAHFKDSIRLGAPDKAVYRELAEAHLALDELQEAGRWVAEGERNGAPPGELFFFKGLIQQKEKRYDDALKSFEQARQLDRKLAHQAEFQIAMIHAAGKRLDLARTSLQALIKLSPDSELSDYARDYERELAAALDSHRTWYGSVIAGYMYDSNAITKPRQDIPALKLPNPEDRGFAGNFRLNYNPLLSGDMLFNAQYSIATTTYEHRHTNNTIVQNLTLTPGVSLSRGAVTLPVSYTHYLLEERNYLHSVSVRPTGHLLLGAGQIGQLFAGYTRRMMLKDYFNEATRITEDRSSDVFGFGAGYSYLFAGNKGVVSLRYEADYDNADGRNWRNWGHKVSASALVPLTRTISLNAAGEAFFQDYSGTNSVFGVSRNDTTVTASAGATWEFLDNLRLLAQYSHTRADSNIFIYDYTRDTVMGGIEFRF